VLLVVLLVAPSAASAALTSIPFKAYALAHDTSQTVEPDGIHFTSQAAGTGTYVGKFTEAIAYTLRFDFVTFSGSGTITAADGGTLSFDFQGTIPGFPGGVFPTPYQVMYSMTGGTGRFADTTGGGTAVGLDYGKGTFDQNFTGYLSKDAGAY
jgi:hypothetical protein